MTVPIFNSYEIPLITGAAGFELYDSSCVWTVSQNVTPTGDNGITGASQWHNNTLLVNAIVTTTDITSTGIQLKGPWSTIKIGPSGAVGGPSTAIAMYGDHSVLINDGLISGSDKSVNIDGKSYAGFVNNNEVRNSVDLKGKEIFVSLGDKSKLLNQLQVLSEKGGIATILNKGTIVKPSNWAWACNCLNGNDTFINTGTIDGLVGLGAGNDTFDNRNGKVTGAVYGYDGNDTFIVDSAIAIVEVGGEGTDTIQSTVTLSLSSTLYDPQELENLTLIGSATIDGTGNGLNNVIAGNAAANRLQGLAGNDTLDGGAGADMLEGGMGEDVYHVDNAADRVVEAANAGIDTVLASVHYGLAADASVEFLRAAASALSLALTGNGLANTIEGSAGRDTLDGGAGADRLEGGLGNDTYVIDTLDTVIDSGGIDTVMAAFSFNLAALPQLEHLTATGTAALALTGNSLANALTGNGAANKLSGGLGKDVLTGGAGKDVFVFDTKPNAKTNLDKIVDFSVKDDSVFLDNKYMVKLGKGTPTKPLKLDKGFFILGPKAKDKDDYLVYNNKTGVLSYDADGSGSKAAVAVATLKKGLKMTYADFFVI